MIKKNMLLMAVVGLTASMAGADVLSFVGGGGTTLNSSGDTLALTNNTANNTVVNGAERVNFMNNITLTGANSVNDDFVLTFNAGFSFVPGTPTWDTTDAGANNVMRIVSGQGFAPNGSNARFGEAEILWFEVSGLETGNTLQLNGFTMEDHTAAESDFLSYYTNGVNPSGATAVTDGGVVAFGTALILNNGDKFGIGFTAAGVNRSSLQSLNIEVIPEPATLGLVVAFGGGLLFIRRCFMM